MNSLNKGFESISKGFQSIFSSKTIDYDELMNEEMPYNSKNDTQPFNNKKVDPKDPFGVMKK